MTMPYPPLHQSQTGIIQAVLPGLGSFSGPLQGSVNPQLTTVGGRFKESTSQVCFLNVFQIRISNFWPRKDWKSMIYLKCCRT